MPSDRPPRIAVIVANGITGDSRVQKIALSAAHDGWEVLLIGRSPSSKVQKSRIGDVQVLRVPVQNDMVRAENLRRQAGSKAFQPWTTVPSGRELWQSEYESRQRMRSVDVVSLAERNTPLASTARFGVRGVSLLDRKVHAAQLRLWNWELGRQLDPAESVGDWRHDQPTLLDLDLAFGPAIERFKPDVIHVNDITMLNTGAVAAARLRRRGHRVAWVYDAHEYVAGVDWPTERTMSAYPELEREFIRLADAVVTVSPEIAELLRADHDLATVPLVVRNTPVRSVIGRPDAGSVRDAAGLGVDTPILVYSGYIHVDRGLGTAIDALLLLPDVHLVIVADQNNKLLAKLLRQANRIGVADRVHSVPYVDPQDVADYLSTADIGIICSKKTINYELSLPTKLAEYLHAGLPVVVSDVKTLSSYVRDHGIGEIFEAGSHESFARVVRTTLDSRAAMRARITDAVLDDLSWERQAEGLLRLYRTLSGRSPEPRGDASWDVTEERAPVRRSTSGHAKHVVSGDDVPWRQLANTKVKLGLGIANSAGQLAALAQAVTDANPDVSAEVVTRSTGASFGYPSDVYLSAKRLGDLTVQLDLAKHVLSSYTHVLSDALTPILGYLNGTDIAGDVPALRQAGIKVALLCHGSEIRDPYRHIKAVSNSHFQLAPPRVLENLARAARRNAEIIQELGLPVYVTTPDLLADVPNARWVPLVVDVEAWHCDAEILVSRRPVVLHAPSRRWTKGTERFLPDLQQLADRGIIELRIVEKVPWNTMRDLVKAADIIVDQVGIGSYGTLACEGMAAGKAVVVHLRDLVVENVKAEIGQVLPLIDTSPLKVAETVERILDTRAEARSVAQQAREFARNVHDGRRSADVLSSFLRS